MELKDLNLTDYDLVDIKSIIKTKNKVKMNDIQVEDNETFFLENGILTHNSAISAFTDVRDPETQAGMPLRGKVLNVYGKPAIDAMENAEVADIVTAINLEFNEQMGDYIIKDNAVVYDITYESIFEVDKEGNSLIKEATVLGTDKFHLNKRWVAVEKLSGNVDSYFGYIKSITISEKNIDALSPPDYFHFRRPWDSRGFRKVGVPYFVSIDKESFVCNDIDDIFVDGEWMKVSLFIKKAPKTKQNIKLEKAPNGTKLTRVHKLVNPSFDTKLKFSKVFVATDADPDGSSIFNLLLNLFHEYFPELFWDEEIPFISRILFPMIAATKGKKTLYFANRNDFEKAKQNGKVDDSYKIMYFKGLGSMEREDWEHVFNDLETYSMNVIDDGHLDELMQIFFDSDANVRKEWLAVKD